MGRVRLAWFAIGGAIALACSGEEFSTGGTGGNSAAGGLSGGAGTSGSGATGATGATGGTGATGATGGTGATGATGGAGASGASGGAGGNGGIAGASGAAGSDGGSTSCPAPSSYTLLASVGNNPEYPLVNGTNLFFTTDQAIIREPLAGGSPTTLFSDAASQNEGLAVVTHNLYWADRGQSQLRHLDLTNNAQTLLASNQAGIQTVGTDGSFVYWTYDGGIRRRGSSGIEDVYSSPNAYALAVTEAELFWVTLQGNVYKAAKSPGSTPAPIASQSPPAGASWSAVTIALDATHVYWTARAATTVSIDAGAPSDGVWRVPRGGGQMETVGITPNAEGLALSTTCVYWGSRGVNGRIYVRNKLLSFPPSSLGNLQFPRGLVYEGGTLYFTDSQAGTINRANP